MTDRTAGAAGSIGPAREDSATVGGVKRGRLRRGPVRIWWAVAGLAVAILGACAKDAPMDTLEPAGPIARQIDDLINPVFIVAGVVFVLVQFLVVYSVIRFRSRPGQEEPVQVHGNTKLEITWTAAPALVLLVIAFPTLATIYDLSERGGPDSLQVTVVARQFWWEYRYDDLGVVTANELVIPVDREVDLSLESIDVIHSFWVPKLAGKTDVVPTRVNHMRLIAEEPGTYQGQCTEYCGLSHANMRLTAVAMPPGDFEAWVENQRGDAPTPRTGTEAAAGAEIFVAQCTACHTVAGVSDGQIGPNLTTFASRATFAGAIFENEPDNLRTWLENPPGVKPGALMPDLGLSEEQITSLIAYLETLK